MASDTLVVITSKAEFDAALNNTDGKAVVVDFHATWCGPCKMIAPRFKELAEQYKEKVLTLKVDVDEADDVAKDCNITAMPTFQLYKNGKKVDEMKGANQQKLEEMFSKANTL